MRPKLVDALNGALGTHAFAWVIPTPALLYLLAMLVVMTVYVRRCQQVGLRQYHALGAAIWAMLGGLLGARLLYLALRLNEVADAPTVMLDLGGSTMSWGAYLGGGLGFTLYFLKHRESFGHYADAAASTFGLGPCLGRIACFLNGDDYGKVTGVAWAVTYPRDSYPFADHVSQDLLDPSAAESLPVHPVQLYMAANGLVLFVLFSWLWRRHRLRPGRLFLLYWMAYGATRFGLEFFRGDRSRTFAGSLPDAQLIAAVVCVAALAAAIALRPQRGIGLSSESHA